MLSILNISTSALADSNLRPRSENIVNAAAVLAHRWSDRLTRGVRKLPSQFYKRAALGYSLPEPFGRARCSHRNRSQKRKNRIGPPPRRSRADPMRLTPGGAAIRRRAVWNAVPYTGQGPRPTSPPVRPNNDRYLDPLGEIYNSIPIKNPSAATAKEKNNELGLTAKHRLPQARCLFRPILLPPACCCRGTGLRGYFANSPLDLAIAQPTVNGCKPF
jgi:hypothetical protein